MAWTKPKHKSHVNARRIYKVRWLGEWLDARTERIRRELGVPRESAKKKGEEK